MIFDSYYTTDSAAEFLGITVGTVRVLTAQKKLIPTKVGQSNLYHIDGLKACRDRWYADGMTPKEIAEVYGKTKGTVLYHFSRLNVRAIGVDGRRKGQPTVYDPSTVRKITKILGWTIVYPGLPQNPTCEP
jgi:excisionase family DNA binding protein